MSVTESDSFDALLKRAARLTPLPSRDTNRRGRSHRPVPLALAPGSMLWGGRFQIVRKLGSGGMGVVYEAQDQERDERVALKTLSRLDANGIYRLKQEFRALSEVAHENLIVLHELFADDDHCFFTMELVLGEPFDRHVRPMLGTGMPVLHERRLRDALPQLVRGVSAIHGGGKLHRDLKPSNVLVTAAGRVVILDFGLVADRSDKALEQANDDDRGSGTPAYMSPEQCARRAATEASDWYAVGVMVFEALTGKLPFADSSNVLMRRKQDEEAPAASTLSRGSAIARDLEELCSKLLAREPSARPSGAELLELLPEVAPARASVAPPASALVGRKRELAALHHAFERAEERAVVVCLTGESGMGKSALSAAFVEEIRGPARAIVLEGRCYEREYLPYKGLDRAIDGLTRFLRQLEGAEVAALLPQDIGALARIFPVLDRVDAIAGTPTHAVAGDEDAQLLRRRAFGALTELLTRLGAQRRLVLSIDDAQWIDGDSIALIDHILGSGDLRILVIINQRSFDDGPLLRQLGQRLAIDTIAIGPLEHDAMLELALQRLDTLPEVRDRHALAASIAREAHGNPFFAGELSQSAVSSSPPRAVSLEHALRDRTAALGDDARELLELLALAGRPTPASVLGLAARSENRRSSAPPPPQPQRALDRLRKAQLLRESPGGGLECYHDRVRTALVEGIGSDRARSLHARLADAWSSHGQADPEVLFAHCYAAGQRAQAAMHALHAAQSSAASLAFDRSASFLQHALELLPEEEIAAQDVRARYAEALSCSGRWADASVAYERAARASESAEQRIELLRRSARHLLGSGHGAEGLPRLREVFLARGVMWPRWRWLALLGAFAALLLVLPKLLRDAGRSLPIGRPTASTALEPLLEGAGFVTPYDMPRGLYFLMRFAARAMHSGEAPSITVALAMLSSMLSSVRATRALSLELASTAIERANALDPSTPHAAVALTFAAYTRLVGGELQGALALGVRAEELLGPVPRTHSYQFWNARTVQSMALVLLGRMREARALYEATGRLARELGDDLAVLGGESPLRYLVVDDAASANALVARKKAMLGGVPSSGAVHRVVAIDRLMCALYEGIGADLIWPADGRREPRLFFFDATVLHACCALQGMAMKHPRANEAPRLVKRALRTLSKLAPTPGVLGMSAQLRAAQCLMQRDEAGARAQLEGAIDCYTRADMALHASLMRCRAAELAGDVDAVSREQAVLHAMGLENPCAWAHMLAPGLVRS